MEVLNVTYHCKPGKRVEFINAIVTEGIDVACRNEEGNLKYGYYLPTDSADDMLLIEKWRDADCLAAHGKQPHYLRLGELKAQFVDETVLEKFHVD
ncbi:MAG: antibiotic biosynthesis monooxygenase [Eubacterium sp.]|nr:antibiotic biosynthesis monooxygenase [Eubacterium sp.]